MFNHSDTSPVDGLMTAAAVVRVRGLPARPGLGPLPGSASPDQDGAGTRAALPVLQGPRLPGLADLGDRWD